MIDAEMMIEMERAIENDRLREELTKLRAENESLKHKVEVLELDLFNLECEMRECGDY